MQDFGSGIDQLSAENKIPDGFSELLLNADPTPEGYLAKRKGYQGHAGNLPLRINRIEYSTAATDNICFLFDSSVDISSIDFSTVRSSPIIVYGKTNTAHSGDFTSTNSVHYYPSFIIDNKREFLVGSNTTTILGTEHGGGNLLFVGLAESTTTLNNSNSVFSPDSISVNQISDDVSIDYTNGTLSTFKGYIIIKDKPVTPGTTYATASIPVAPGTSTISVTAGTHGLSDFNILAKVFLDDGTSFIEVIPDSVTIQPTGQVDTVITNSTAGSLNFKVLLTAVPAANFKTGTTPASSTNTVVIDNLDNDFIFVGCYLELTPGGNKELVIPDSIDVDAIAKTATITFVNNNITGANFYIFYETAPIVSNKLCVTGTVIGAPYSEDNPQLTLWGLSHEEIYGPNPTASRIGWTNHIDSYRSAADNRLISGLGGNVFQAGGDADTYLLPTLFPNMRNRVGSSTNVGPAFVDNLDVSNRTRGYLTFEGAGEGWAKATSSTWVTGNQIKYTLSVPSLSINGVLSTIISSTTGLEDYLTVEQAGYKINEGVFKILTVSNPSGNILEVTVENPNRDGPDWDESDAGMQVGVFTDRLPLFTSSTFLPEDTLDSNIFTDGNAFTVVSSSGTTLVVQGATELVNFPAGIIIVCSRITNIIPLQDALNNPSVLNMVRGDMVIYDDLKRQLRIVNVNDESNVSVTITSQGDGTALVTLGSGDTDNLAVGQSLNIIQAGIFTGTFDIANIVDNTNFTIVTDISGTSISGTIQGKTIEVDEVLLVQDTVDQEVSVSVPQRWIPIEIPEDSYDTTPQAVYRQFDGELYSEQPIIRSTMVSDNMYFANGVDEILKFDGSNIYRAGLPRWQPSLFFTVDTAPPAPEVGKIDINDVTCSTTGVFWTNNRFIVDTKDKNTFAIGSKIRYSLTSPTFTVQRVDDDSATTGLILVDRNIGGTPAASTLRQVYTYRYYFRLNAIDANDNIIASTITGAEDNLIELVQDSQVRIRLVGLPAWDLYDYDRLEVEVYRTKADTPAPFYRLATIPMSFNNNTGYVDYIDTDADDTLVDLDVTSALSGQELGTTWSEPLRAKYITSLANRLVLGNVKGYPKLDMQFVDTGTRISASVLAGTSYFFRKDNNDTGTATDMSTRIRYSFVDNSLAVIIAPATDVVNNAGASFTVTSVAHGLVAGDWVYLYKNAIADGNRLQYSGWWMINSATANTFTILHSHSSTYTPAAQDVDRFVTAPIKQDVPVLLAIDGNYSQLNANPAVTTAYQFTAVKRIANAINVSMRKTDKTVKTDFNPWLVGNAGSEFNFGQLVITQPKTIDTIAEVLLPTITGYNLFINGIKRSSAQQISTSTNLFPSRVLMSFQNFPEIIDNPEATLDSDSLSAIDVNPADGQEITGIIPFFGESAFGAAQRDSILLVFKTNSIYLVNLAAKAAGASSVQKIESRGLGCTAPYSISVTKNGIMFANESGMYRLSQNMDVVYIGRKMERIWKQSVDRDKLSIMTGHYYSNANKYKLSVPYKTDTNNDKVMVYDTTREYQADGYRDGGWTVYDNHPATGWANLQTQAFMASTKGRVFIIRDTGLKYDFRDDSSAINMQATLRALDFGEPATRKAVLSAILQFRVLQSTAGTEVLSASNLVDNFQPLDIFHLDEPTDEEDSLSDFNDIKVKTLRFSIKDRKVVYMQLKISNDTIDEPVEIAGVNFRVAGLKQTGIGEAADS